MSEIKALESLRNCLSSATYDGMLDAIQAEVDERFMELPLDADGVPIHVGDVIESHGTIFNALGICMNSYGNLCVQGGKHNVKLSPDACRHVKPRTLESVLQEYGSEIADSASKPWSEIVDKYAAEIRELLGVDA